MAPEGYKRFLGSKLPLCSRMPLSGAMPGEWPSAIAGEGIDFAATRPYEPGDDLRDLDLQTLAQSGEEEIVLRVAGRQRQVHIWADWSGSLGRDAGPLFASRPEIRDIAIGQLLFSAWHAASPVGFCAFHRARTHFPARFGRRHCVAIWDWIDGPGRSTPPGPACVPDALDLLLATAPPESLVFFISDFQDPAFEGDCTALLRPVAQKLDFVAVVIRDPLETRARLRWPVSVAVQDGEGAGSAEIRLTPGTLAQMQEASARHLAALGQSFRRLGIDHVVLDSPSADVCYERLALFFDARKRARSQG